MAQITQSAAKVQVALSALGLECTVVELPASTRTAADAASAIGCTIGQIVKSLVFRGRTSGQPILVLASGEHRVDEQRLAALAGETVEKADADFVRQHSGFAIGGVPPVGHAHPMRTVIDAHLLEHQDLWAAAGTPHAVFRLHSRDLRRMVNGEVATIAR